MQAHSHSAEKLATLNYLLLSVAWIAAWLVYSPAIGAGWFWDDADYVVNDPRLDRIELFLPSHWSDPPPPLESARGESVVLPGYGKPLIADRYLWRLSYALERYVFGEKDGPGLAHAINLMLHLTCVGALFYALSRLLRLYRRKDSIWSLLPGVAALIFAVHPWASEPACYVSARSASLGSLFVLLAVGLAAVMLLPETPRWKRLASAAGVLVCAAAAFGCRENYITALAACALVVWPAVLGFTAETAEGAEKSKKQKYLSALSASSAWKAAGVIIVVAALLGGAWLGISLSDRAAGLWAAVGERGWRYFFEIQNPLVLSTLFDQLPVQRISLETNHPGWPFWACATALLANALIVSLSMACAARWPLLLGLSWFYLHLLPTNSVLPRPDFLAARNVYLPVAGTATLLAGGLLLLWSWLDRKLASGAQLSLGLAGASRGQRTAAGAACVLLLYWGIAAHGWAAKFAEPEKLWAHSARQAPGHAAVRLNLACAILRRPELKAADRSAAAAEATAALAALDSPTMQYQDERHQLVYRSLAWRLLGNVGEQQQDWARAAGCFKKSWESAPSLVTWVAWASSSLNGKLASDADAAVAAGLRHWPDGWWPRAARGLAADTSVPARLEDLAAAESASDASLPELRSLQRAAIYELALARPEQARERQWLERLKRLGVPASDLGRLQAVLFPQPNKGMSCSGQME